MENSMIKVNSKSSVPLYEQIQSKVKELILKNALREKLKDYSNVYFQPAPFARFGMGAIEVMIMHTRE